MSYDQAEDKRMCYEPSYCFPVYFLLVAAVNVTHSALVRLTGTYSC